MNKIIFLMIAYLSFPAAIYGLYKISGGNPIVALVSFVAIITVARIFEKHKLPEEETLFSWIKKKLN